MQSGDVVAARFDVESFAGAGGMGAVFRAHDRSDGSVVALKVLTVRGPGQAERFGREAEVLRALHHPAIVRYVSHGATHAGELFLAIEWLDGEDLETRLSRKSLSVRESVALALRVAEGLGVAHALGVVHRDIKPSNLFLPGRELDAVKIIDFGIARGGDLPLAARAGTQTGALVGTPGYMAPEQARGERRIDARADVFSLGCVLFECAAGRPTFAGDNVMAVLAKILLEETPRLGEVRPDLPPSLDDLVARMLAKEASARPLDGTAVAAELLRLGDLDAPTRAVVSAREGSITRAEQRLLAVVFAAGPGRVDVTALTLDSDAASTLAERALEDTLRDAVRPFDAHVARLVDGSVVATLAGRGSATDQAARAARCALALRAILTETPMALATGRGNVAARLPIGEVIDRAATMVRARDAAPAPAIRLDELTAGLLADRFEVSAGVGLSLVRESDVVDTTRKLLGRPTPCVGRERELGTLASIFDECVAEQEPRAVLVTAPAGVGKSRLRHELLRALVARGAPVEIWIGRGDPMSAGAAFSMIAPFLRRAAGILDGEPLDARRKKLAARVSRHVALADQRRVTEFLGELIGAPFADDERVELRSAKREAIVMGDQMRRAWEDFLAAESAAQPVLIVLEDLHWGDLPSVSYVDSALRVLKDGPFMVLGFARPEVHDAFPKLWAGRAVTQMELQGLSKRASEKLVKSVLGEDAAPPMIERIVAQAAGNAFYLEELLRAVTEGSGDALPDTVLAMVQARLEALDPEARRVLRAASVFGQVFWSGAVGALLGGARSAKDVKKLVGELLDQELVVELGHSRFPGDSEYSFRHAVVREAAYAMLTNDDRALGHRLAGAWLETAGETDAAVVADHFDRGKASERAVGWYLRAVTQALDGNDFAAVIARAERAVGCGAMGEDLGMLRLREAQSHLWRGEFEEALVRGSDAMSTLAVGTPAWSAAASEVANAGLKLGRMDRPEALAALFRDLLASGAADGAMAGASARVALIMSLAGRMEAADALFEAIDRLSLAVVERDPRARAAIAMARAVRAAVAGDTGACLALNQVALTCYSEAGDARNACGALINLGDAHLQLGEYREAELQMRDASAAATRMGLTHLAAAVSMNLGVALARRGALDEADVALTGAMEVFREQRDRRFEGACLSEHAGILLARGDVTSAEHEARAAVDALTLHPPLRAFALAMLARVLIGRGAIDEAVESGGEAKRVLDSLGGIDTGEALVRLVHAETLHLAGDIDAARAAIAAARDRILERALKITDARHRANFLDRAEEHERTLTLAHRWCDADAPPLQGH